MPLNKVALFSKEYPPHVYGGAEVHVEYLARALARSIDVEVRVFGEQSEQDGRISVRGYEQWAETAANTDPRFVGAIDAFARSLVMAKDRLDADLVHCHTWYTDMGGLLASKLWGVPYVLTIHSLEPLRPWKVEQLGRGYDLSTWMERTAIEQADAIIAVSRETKQDVLRLFDVKPERVHVIHNGVDLDEYRFDAEPGCDVLTSHGIDPDRPIMLFVGRITRQKGIIHLMRAIGLIDPSLQIVLCAGAADTPEIGEEMAQAVGAIQQTRQGVVWISEMLPRADVIQLYTHAAIFCCPSVYEPFGIINLEAMACGCAVVASAVGGIVGGGGGRGDGPAGGRGPDRGQFRAGRPAGLRRTAGGGHQPAGGGPGPVPAVCAGGAPAGGGTVQLGCDREPHPRAVSRPAAQYPAPA